MTGFQYFQQMDAQEQFFKEQIKNMHEARDAMEDKFEVLQQQERERVKQSNTNPSNTAEFRCRYSDFDTTPVVL